MTPDNPVLLSRWDGEAFLGNGRALEAAGAECTWEGVECRDGEPTGRLWTSAASGSSTRRSSAGRRSPGGWPADEKGTLAPGKLADLVVLDRDPFGLAPDALKDLEVVLTMVGGRIVHRAESAAR